MSAKIRTTFDWDDVRVFLAVARAGSLSAAARQLGINHATVFRRLAALEQRVAATPLFERTRTGVVLTSAGEGAIAEAEALELAAQAFGRAAGAGEALAGPVRVSATATFADRFLTPPLARLAIDQPALELELLTDDRFVSVWRGEADIAIRMGRPGSEDALARKIADLPYLLCASPDYLAAVPPEQRRMIGFTAPVASVATIAQRLEEIAQGRFALRCSTFRGQAEASAAGGGMALLPWYLVDERLRRVDEHSAPEWSQPLWLVLRSDVRRVPRVRYVADRLYDSLAGELRGARPA